MKDLLKDFKKLPAIAILMLLAVLMLAACGGGGEKANSDGAGDGKEEPIKLRLNSQIPPSVEGSPTYIAQEVFADMVKERTNGRVEIEIFYNNQLAGQAESLDALARGTIDLQFSPPVAWADKIPEGNWSSMPYAWKSEEHVLHLLRETELGELYDEALAEYGVKTLHYYFSAGAGYLSKSPIEKPEDLKGKVVNSLGLANEFYKATGSGLASIPFADYYEGLLRGTIDVVMFPYYSLETMKLSEVVDYISVPGVNNPSVGIVAVSLKTWEKLPKDLQEIIQEVSLEIEQLGAPASKAFTERGIEYGKEQGVEVVEISDEDYQKFVEISKETYWKKFAEVSDRTKRMVEVVEENLDWEE